MAIEGIIEGFPNVKIHNPDGTTGPQPKASVPSVGLANEDQLLLQSMSDALDIPISSLSAALENISINNFPVDYPDANGLLKLTDLEVILAAIKAQTDKLTFAGTDLQVLPTAAQSDFVGSTPAYLTTDLFVQVALPYVTKLRLNKSFLVRNTGIVNDVDIEIRGSIDNGITFPDIIRNQTLAPGQFLFRNDRNYYTHIQIVAKSTNLGLPSTVTTQIAAL